VTDAFAVIKRAGCETRSRPAGAVACALQRRRGWRVATCVLALALGAGLWAPGRARAWAGAPTPLAPALDVLPLPALRVTGGYGELRGNHVHAGLDFSTGGHVGAAVRAPLAGWVERVRASGVGYGRSLYVRAGDGRLLVFGHLDAFAPAVARYVDSTQVAGAQYEQDLWPAAGRFRFAMGETLAWSGESGIGSPHLHFEIRHGDFALNPLRAGVTQAAGKPPTLESLTLEPLDEHSWAARHASPFLTALAARAETVLVDGSVRAIVTARAGFAGVRDAPAWSTSAEWNGATIEARLDSISWAGEMEQLDLVMDRGRVNGSGGFILWRPRGVSPRFLVNEGAAWDGTIVVRAGDPTRPLVLRARDADGRGVERTVWLRGPRDGERGPDTTGVAPRLSVPAPMWTFASLDARRLRVSIIGVPQGTRDVRLGFDAEPGTPATLEAGAWCAVLRARSGPAGLFARGQAADGRSWEGHALVRLWSSDADGDAAPLGGGGTLLLPRDAFYEPQLLVIASSPAPEAGRAGALGGSWTIAPPRAPVRHPVAMEVVLPPGVDPQHVDLYRAGDAGWTPLRARWDAARRVLGAETSAFGTFALRRDDVAPLIALQRPARRAALAPYSRWQLVARVKEADSGLDARASAFEVDGVRVPSEWDPEGGELRWRPARAPAAGRHRYAVVAVDRAGNAARSEGSFVLDSATR
jgi:hypothetical protein